MQLLRTPGDYASAGVYVAPTKVWDGQPRLVYPTPSQIINGATPDTALPAELENGRNKILFDAQCVQIHDAMKFTRTDLVVGTSTMTRLSAIQQTGGVGAPSLRQKSILVSGASSGGAMQDSLLNDGTVGPAAFSSLAGAAAKSAPACDSNGLIFFGLVGGTTSIITSSDGGVTPTTQAVAGLIGGAYWVGATGSRYILFERGTQKIFSATSIAGAWTTVVTTFDTVVDMATDGAGTWVMFGQAVGGVTQTMRSTDDGATWGSLAGMIYSATGVSGTWSDEWQAFIAIDGNGKLWASPTGVTWTLQKTMFALNGLIFGQNALASCGCAIACIVNRPANSLGKNPRGIAFTLDHGATWNESYIGDATTANRSFSNILAANGRFYAIDGGSLYQSGVLAAPATIFTGV